jgi:hypothetical protein
VIFSVRIGSRRHLPPLIQLTALTTSFCVDFLAMDKAEKSQQSQRCQKQDILFILFFVFNVSGYRLFNVINDSSVVGMIFRVASIPTAPTDCKLFGLFMKSKRSGINGAHNTCCLQNF